MSTDQSQPVQENPLAAQPVHRGADVSLSAEDSLQESERKYQRLVEDIGGDYAIYTHSPEGVITYVSPSIENVLGYSVDSVLGLNWRDLIGEHFVGRNEGDRVADDVVAGKKLYRFQVEIAHADGSTRLIEVQQRPLFDSAGRYISMEGIAKDITQQTRDAEELQKLKHDLELRVAQRTADLIRSNEQLREKEAHLAHMSRLTTMGELVAGIAHEIHQPLHAAKTFSEAARRNLEKGAPENIETAIDCTKEISKAITRTATIIRHLRDFTRSRPVNFELLDVNEVVRGACEILAFETRKAQVKLHFDLTPELPGIEGDRVQLEQACVNILINAYEAMNATPPEKRKLVVSTQFNSQFVNLAFRDAGCGFATSDKERLFDVFYSTKPQGLGMGLSLCKSIAETHGGQIRAGKLEEHEGNKGNEGPGAMFVLELPIPNRPSRRPSHG